MAVACERAGIPYASPHALRHSFCTHLADDGVNPWTLRDLARHASITTTEKYLHLNQRHRSLVARLEETP
jgi:site-specific recombinase XerD